MPVKSIGNIDKILEGFERTRELYVLQHTVFADVAMIPRAQD